MSLPNISATTPKVSLFKFTSSGYREKLIAACIKQTEEFSDIAVEKVKFMQSNQFGLQDPNKQDDTNVFPCVVLNATGVRLSLKSGTSAYGYPNYPAPDLIEPGECASFLLLSHDDLNIKNMASYEIQVFEGPVPFGNPPAGGGWQAPTGDLSIPQFELFGRFGDFGVVQPSTAKGSLQDMAGGGFVKCTFTWTVKSIPGFAAQSGLFTITQSLD